MIFAHTLQALPQPLPFLARPLAVRVVQVFADNKVAVRFIGGCVRDALLGLYTARTDLDLATPVTPDVVTQLLEAAGLTVRPTGIAYGTVTVVDGSGDKLEITTLRRDVETDGRHATVAFGTDWSLDAARRDFTINALSVTPGGQLFDTHNGQADLADGRVRFIGAAVARIREDYLRILRFFRFHARFGTGEADAEALGACAALKTGLKDLSAERIWQELSRLLALPQPQRGILPMDQCGILDVLFKDCCGEPDLDRLDAYATLEAHTDFQPVPVLRLAALYPDAGEPLAARLRLSRREAAWLEVAGDTLAAETLSAIAQTWYWHQDRIALAPGGSNSWPIGLIFLYHAVHPASDLDTLISYAAGWEPKVLPLTGSDLIRLGVESGPRMGEILDVIEQWWVAENFRPDYVACMARVETLLLL